MWFEFLRLDGKTLDKCTVLIFFLDFPFSLYYSLVVSANVCSCAQDVFWHAQAVESKMQTGGYLLLLYFDK